MSSLETDPCYRSNDYLAVMLLPVPIRIVARLSCFRILFRRVMAPKGMYEYVIARTKYIDDVFTNALSTHFDQILIFGAGFDTRALRFAHITGNTQIFEIDAPVTQNAKINQYRNRNITIPPNLTFLPVNFEKETLQVKLEEAGFMRNKKSLFILEGLLMYLSPEFVNSTFRTIRLLGGSHSEVVFDGIYASVLRRENHFYGEKDVLDTVSKAGECWKFGIEQGKTTELLEVHGFTLLEEKNAQDLEKTYFRNRCEKRPDTTLDKDSGVINSTHFLVRAAIP